MRHLTRTLALSGVIAALGTGVLAQDSDPGSMTCAEFIALTADEQMTAMDALRSADMASDAAAGGDAADASASDMDAAADASADSAAATDTGASAASDTAATGDSPSTATDTAAAPDAGEALSTDPEIAGLLANCQGYEDAPVSERMTATEG